MLNRYANGSGIQGCCGAGVLHDIQGYLVTALGREEPEFKNKVLEDVRDCITRGNITHQHYAGGTYPAVWIYFTSHKGVKECLEKELGFKTISQFYNRNSGLTVYTMEVEASQK